MLLNQSSPPASFAEPLALLQACHDKVRRFAGLTLLIDAHLGRHGADAQAADAAADVLRYFDLAAPLHHADEEEDLFPALRELGDAYLLRSMDALETEHRDLERLWRAVRPWLVAVAEGGVPVRPAELADFARRYPAHADREEAEVYPQAHRLGADSLAALGRAMEARRGAAR